MQCPLYARSVIQRETQRGACHKPAPSACTQRLHEPDATVRPARARRPGDARCRCSPRARFPAPMRATSPFPAPARARRLTPAAAACSPAPNETRAASLPFATAGPPAPSTSPSSAAPLSPTPTTTARRPARVHRLSRRPPAPNETRAATVRSTPARHPSFDARSRHNRPVTPPRRLSLAPPGLTARRPPRRSPAPPARPARSTRGVYVHAARSHAELAPRPPILACVESAPCVCMCPGPPAAALVSGVPSASAIHRADVARARNDTPARIFFRRCSHIAAAPCAKPES